jgi:hypothetical protein
MENILKKGHSGIVAQFHAIQAFETPSQPIHPDMQLVLAKHQSIFETPQGLPPSQGEHDHSISHTRYPPTQCMPLSPSIFPKK